jgi:hypothetical protein
MPRLEVLSLKLEVIFQVCGANAVEFLELTFHPLSPDGGLLDFHLSLGEFRLAGTVSVDIL